MSVCDLSNISTVMLRDHIKLRVYRANEILTELKILVDELESRGGSR